MFQYQFLIQVVNKVPRSYFQPFKMQQAIFTGNVVKLEYLMAQGYPLNKPDNDLGLYWEPNYNFYQLVSGDLFYANSFGSNAKYGDNIPWTPLQYAAILGNDKIVETLLLKCDPFIRDRAGQTAKDIASRRAHVSTVDIISSAMEKTPIIQDNTPKDSVSESQGELNYLRSENISLKNELSNHKTSVVRFATERESLASENEILKVYAKDPRSLLSDPSKLQELITLGIPLGGVCIIGDAFNSIDVNSAKKLGAIGSLADLASTVDGMMLSEKLDLIACERLSSGLEEILSKWKLDQFNSIELDREMMNLSDKLILSEKIGYLKNNAEILYKHVFEQYQLSKTSSKVKNCVLYQFLDRFTTQGDDHVIREIIKEFVDPWIAGKAESEIDMICESYRLDIKHIMKLFKAKFELSHVLPEWDKRLSFLKSIQNGKGKEISKSLK